jgi:hypothetical protein
MISSTFRFVIQLHDSDEGEPVSCQVEDCSFKQKQKDGSHSMTNFMD